MAKPPPVTDISVPKDSNISARPLKSAGEGRIAQGLLAIGSVIGGVTRPLLGKRGLGVESLIKHWDDIVGPTVAVATIPERLKFMRNGRGEGELQVRVASGPFAVQLQHHAPVVIERINGFLGYKAVMRLKIIQAPLPIRARRDPPPFRSLTGEEEQSLACQIDSVEDPDLKAVLDKLGRALMGRCSV